MAVVIVAIPEAQDRVHKASSEKVPHLTLMYLGDDVPAEKLIRIVQFVEHVADVSLTRFGLSVDRRDTLGDKEADVLFFRKDWESKNLKEVLNSLLSNRDIYEAYHSSTQFPDWVPHLTLGYPEAPAKELDDDYGFHWVAFDRIAVWTGDYDGPEFRLKDNDDGVEAAWSALAIAGGTSILKAMEKFKKGDARQFGVKGMRWGVRRSPEQLARGAAVSEDGQTVLPAKVNLSTGAVTPTSPIPSLSNTQMQNLVSRIKLDQEYAKLTAPASPAQSTQQKGQRAITRLMKDIAADNITKLAKAHTANVLANLLEKKGKTHLADAVRTKDAKDRIKKAEKDAEKAAKKAAEDTKAAPTPQPSQQTTPPPRATAKSSSQAPYSTAVVRMQQNPAHRRSRRAEKIYEVTTLPRN